LFEAATFLHKARSGRLIFRMTREAPVGASLLDEGGRRLGKIIELIGPVKSPYASVAPYSDRAGKKGDRAFLNR
jgi:RNA-binding protein